MDTPATTADTTPARDAMQRRALIGYGDVILRLDIDVAYHDYNGLPDTPRIRAARAVVDAIRAWEAASAEDFPNVPPLCVRCGKEKGAHYGTTTRYGMRHHYFCNNYTIHTPGVTDAEVWAQYVAATDASQ